MGNLQKCVFKESHEPCFVAMKIGGNSFDIQLSVQIIVLDIQRDDHTLFRCFTMLQTHSRSGKVKNVEFLKMTTGDHGRAPKMRFQEKP